MKTFVKSFLPALALVVISCAKEKISYVEGGDERTTLITDQAQLNNRIQIYNTPVYFGKGKAAASPFTYVAKVDPPTVNSVSLWATSVSKQGDYVYVTYHTKNDPYGGSIEVIDVSNPSSPVLISQLLLNDTDIHEAYPEGSYLFYSGQRDVFSSPYDTATGFRGAVAGRIDLSGGVLTSTLTESSFKGYAINSITRNGGKIHMISGDKNGGIILSNFNFVPSTDPKELVDFDNGHFLTRKGSKVVALEGGQSGSSKVHYYNYQTTKPADAAIYSLPFSTTLLGRNALTIDGDDAWLAMGADGVVKMSLADGSYTQYYFGVDDVAKSVAVGTDYLFVAQGNDGLIIVDKNNPSFPVVGTYDIDEDANDVVYDSGWVFVAQGNGGLRILKKN